MNNNVKKVLYNYKNFGFMYGTSFLLTKTIFRKLEHITRKHAIKILDKEFGYIYEEEKKNGKNNNQFEKNIFVFWAQGFDKLPEIPQKSIENIEKMYPDYKIHKITLDNFKEYVDIDKNLLNLFENKKISIQTFSDILRYNLLYKYGGVWCDLTLLFFDRIDFEKKIEKNYYYSLNIDCEEKTKLWSKVYPVTYTTFFFATKKESPIMKALNRSYIEYYKKYDFVIDYFLNDYFMILAMQHNLEENTLEKIEKTEGNPFYLLNKIQKNDRNIDYKEIKKCPQKLTWKNITLEGWDING